MEGAGDRGNDEKFVLVARKPCFGLPTGCPSCLTVYLHLKFSGMVFDLHFDTANPDSEDIPSVEHGDYVAFNSEKGGVIESLKVDGVIDLDSKLSAESVSEELAMNAMIGSWLEDALMLQLWLDCGRDAAYEIYFSDLPWVVGKVLFWKQTELVKQRLGIRKSNVEERMSEIYRKSDIAYKALSTRLGDNSFFFENRPTGLDAAYLGHALFVLRASSELCPLKQQLREYENLVRYAENLWVGLLEGGPSSVPRSPSGPSTSSMPSRKSKPYASSKPKSKEKKEKTEEEKAFRRRSKYFLLTQLVAVVVFLSLLGGSNEGDVEIDDDDDDGMSYED